MGKAEELIKTDACEDREDGPAKPIRPGFEEAAGEGNDEAEDRPNPQGHEDFDEGFREHLVKIEAPSGRDRFRYLEKDGEEDKRRGIVQGDDRQQGADHGAFGFVLFHNHERGGRSGGRGDGA